MANVILKFKINKKSPDKTQLVAFDKKKVHFIVKNADKMPKPGEYWECFIWKKTEKFNLVKPYKKIEPQNLKDEKMRVDFFNKVLEILEQMIKDNPTKFEKIVFDENNKPYLKSKQTLEKTKKDFSKDYIVKEMNKMVVVRPILTSEDRDEYNQQQKKK